MPHGSPKGLHSVETFETFNCAWCAPSPGLRRPQGAATSTGVSDLLGHADICITAETYGHLSDEVAKSAMADLSSAFGVSVGVKPAKRPEEAPPDLSESALIRLNSGGRYWVRTSDLFRVREARYRCANRPRWRRDLNPCTRICSPLPRLSATPPWGVRLPLVDWRTLLPKGWARLAPSGRRDSNPRPSPWQGDALPTEPRPRCAISGANPVSGAVRNNSRVHAGSQTVSVGRVGVASRLSS